MADFLLAAACVILLIVAAGLVRLLRGPGEADRMMAVQLLGTGSIALIMLIGVASHQPAMIDVALVLALLAAFAGLAFVRGSDPKPDGEA